MAQSFGDHFEPHVGIGALRQLNMLAEGIESYPHAQYNICMNQGSVKKRAKVGQISIFTEFFLKQDAAHEPECSHVQHFCEKIFEQSCTFFPVTVPLDCGMQKWRGECGV